MAAALLPTSASLRAEGNAVFVQGQNTAIAPVLRRARLEEAIKLYRAAHEAAQDWTERKLAARNVAVSCSKLAALFSDERRTLFWLKQGFEAYGLAEKATAKDTGALPASEQDEWAEKLALTLTMLTEEVFLFAEDRATKSECLYTCVIMRDVPALGPEGHLRLRILHAETHFKLAIEAMETGNYRRSLHELAEAYRPALEALQLAPFGHPSNELCDSILADIQQEECRARSTQERLLADSLLVSHLQHEEKPDMEMVWDVADRYRHACLLAAGKDLECEARALCRLGELYRRVLRMNFLAKPCYESCRNIAGTLPGDISLMAWYAECGAALDTYRAEQEKRDSKEKEARRAAVKTKLAAQFLLLKFERGKGAIEFIKYIYENHPNEKMAAAAEADPNPDAPAPAPADADADAPKPERVATDSVRKQLLSAIRHYHTDKNSEASGCGIEWEVLCNEISVHLTSLLGECGK